MKTTTIRTLGLIAMVPSIAAVLQPIFSALPAEWLNWCALAVAVALIVALALDNGYRLSHERKLEWLQRAERLEAEPPSPVADTDLRTGLVEPDSHVHVLRLNPKDDESIRRA